MTGPQHREDRSELASQNNKDRTMSDGKKWVMRGLRFAACAGVMMAGWHIIVECQLDPLSMAWVLVAFGSLVLQLLIEAISGERLTWRKPNE